MLTIRTIFLEARLYILNGTPNVPPTDFHTLFPTLSEQGNTTLFSFKIAMSRSDVSRHRRNRFSSTSPPF